MGVENVQANRAITGSIAAQGPRPAAAEPDAALAADSMSVRRSAPAAESAKVRTIEGQAFFDTGAATAAGGRHPELDQTLDAVVASIKTLPPDKQRALLADPDFRIDVTGFASNLGSDRNFDNVGLSRRRAQETARYVRTYLQAKGLEIPASTVTATAGGPPGRAKPANDNARADRSARVKVTLPGLDPLPPASRPAPAPQAEPSPAPATPAPEPAAPAEPAAPEAPAPAAAEKALEDFNKATGPMDDQLTKAGAATTTLAEREAAVGRANAALSSAADLLPQLDPVARPGAQALFNGLRDKANRLAERATRERGSLDQLQGQLKAESEELQKAAGAKNKSGFRAMAIKLLDKYRAQDAVGKDLPADAREALARSIAELKRTIYQSVASHSDDSKVNQVDNSYLLGRPGPKFKKAWSALQEFLAASGQPTSEQRSRALSALKEMDEAVRKFDDPLSQEASRAVYDEVAKAVSAKLASG